MSELYYIVENFEEEFSDWTLSENTHMILVLSNLYQRCADTHNTRLIITNFRFTQDLALDVLQEDENNSKRNTTLFGKICSYFPLCLTTSLSFQ